MDSKDRLLNVPCHDNMNSTNLVLFKTIYDHWIKTLVVYKDKPCLFKDIWHIWSCCNVQLLDSFREFLNAEYKDQISDSSLYLPSNELYYKMLETFDNDIDKDWLEGYNVQFISTLQKYTIEFDKKLSFAQSVSQDSRQDQCEVEWLERRDTTNNPQPHAKRRAYKKRKASIEPASDLVKYILNYEATKSNELQSKCIEIKRLSDDNHQLMKELADSREMSEEECKRLSNVFSDQLCTTTHKFEMVTHDYESQIDELKMRCSLYETRCLEKDARIKRLRSDISSSTNESSVIEFV